MASVTNISVVQCGTCFPILSLKGLDDYRLRPPRTHLTVVDIQEIADDMTRKDIEKPCQ